MPSARTLASDLASRARAVTGQPMPSDVVFRHVGDLAYGCSVVTNCKGHGGFPHEHWTLSVKGVADPFADPFVLEVLTGLGAPADCSKQGTYAMWIVIL